MPEERDWYDKTDLAAKILTPIIIFLLGATYSYQQSKADQEQKSMDRVISLTKNLTSGNPGEQQVALALIAREKQLHPDLIPNELLAVALPEVVRVAINSSNPETAEQAKKVAVDLSANTNLAQDVQTSVENVSPRIYIHIPEEGLRDEAKQIESRLEALNYIVPGIEKVSSSPSGAEVRYFKKTEEPEARKLAQQLRDLGVSDAKEAYVSGSEVSTKIRPRHFEIWFGPNSFSAKSNSNQSTPQQSETKTTKQNSE
jgi:hypothetical protein